MPEWKASLEGHPNDLALLARLFASGTHCVVQEGDGHYLRSPDFDEVPDPGAVRHRARLLVEKMNGAATIAEAGFRPVSVGQHFVRLGEGEEEHHAVVVEDVIDVAVNEQVALIIEETLDLRGDLQIKVIRTDGSVEWPGRDVDEVQGSLALAERDEQVAEALRNLLAQEPFQLYKALEVVDADMRRENGGPRYRAIANAGWASRQEIDRFTHTVNAGLGDNARHASAKFDPPSKPMSKEDAYWFIRSIVHQWMKHKSQQSEGGA